MRRPTKKAALFFLLALGTGYTLSLLAMSFVLGAPLRLYGFFNLTLVALLIAVLLMIWLDKPFGLGLFEWREPKPKAERQPALTGELDTGEMTQIGPAEARPGVLFPHEAPSEHWDADFGDSKQVYQGSDLPMWILAGWAAFIIWAVAYLVTGLPTAF